MAEIELYSSAFNDHAFIPGRHAHEEHNVSPALEWSNVPSGAAELLLLCEDPDAPRGVFLHWLVTGIEPESRGVAEGEMPRGGKAWPNSFGEEGWGGPAPPPGDEAHRYFFRLYALSHWPRLPVTPGASDVHEAVDGEALATGTLVGLFQR